jgi:hypothetical protein
METFSLALLNLQDAMAQEGCPLCRCARRAESGLLKSLDWESIDEVGARLRLTYSLGACARHAWRILQLEAAAWEAPFGNAILYEELTKAASARLRKASALADKQARRAPARRFLARLLGRDERREQPERPLAPEEGCRVCLVGQESARLHAETLLEMLAYPEYQALYERSAGVCLPHLRLLLQMAAPGIALQLLMQQSARRLDSLQAG